MDDARPGPDVETPSFADRLIARARALWTPLPALAEPATALTQIRRFALWPRVWIVVTAIVLVYGLIGAFAIPPFVKSRIIAEVEARYGRAIEIDRLGVNPFTLTLDLRDVRVPDADGAEAISFDLLRLNVSGSSLWRGGMAFDEVRLDAPRVRLERRANGEANLSDFAPAPSDEPQQPLRLYIRRLTVSDGALTYNDLARAHPFSERLTPVTFELTDFATSGTGNAFSLSASGERGERVAWSGAFSLEPFASSGNFDFSALDLPTLANWLGADLPFALQSGKLDLDGAYTLALGRDAADMRVVRHTVSVDGEQRALHGRHHLCRLGLRDRGRRNQCGARKHGRGFENTHSATP